jgi:aquaporin Z
MNENIRKIIAECFGTYALVFAGTGAIVINDSTGGVISHVGIALTFGLIVLAMIYAIGDVSGCHINPAVTIGFCIAGRFGLPMVLPYISSQVLGAVLASLTLRAMFPEHASLGATIPSGGALQSFVLEFNLSLILMFVILNVSSGSREQGILAGVAIGAVVALEAMFGGPISGASMNPARSLGPALVAMKMDYVWIYLAAPLLGSYAAVVLFRTIRGENGCASTQENGDVVRIHKVGEVVDI